MLDYNLPDDPRIVEAGAVAGWLLVWALCYADRHETDGFVPAVNLRREVAGHDPDQSGDIITRMVSLGMLASAERLGITGFVIHEDYLRHQLTKAAKDERRQQKAAAGKRGGLRSGEARRKQTRSKRQAKTKQVLHGDNEADAKQTGSRTEADVKQNEATSTSTSTSIFSKEVIAGCISIADAPPTGPTRRSGDFTSLRSLALPPMKRGAR